MQRPMLKITATTLAVVVAFLVLYWLAFVRPWKERWTETVQFLDGTSAQVAMEHSSKPYWGIQHAGGIGGGDDHYTMDILAGGIHYEWSGGDERPFYDFGFRDGKLFMAVLDRSDLGAVRFRYYRSDSANHLQEISPSDFPKELAVQNAWLTPDEAAPLRKMDPEDFVFQRSLTAHSWLHLEKGVDYQDGIYDYKGSNMLTPQFLSDYEKKYMKLKPAAAPAEEAKP